MLRPKGLTTTAGISIIAIAIILVGVAIFFVYKNTKQPNTGLAWSIDDRLVLEKGIASSLTGTVTSGKPGTIALSVSSPDTLSVTLSKNSLQPGDNVDVSFLGETDIENTEVVLNATQGESSASAAISVTVFSDGTTNANGNSNTSQGNQNTNTIQLLQGSLIDGDFNITMDYPIAWGEVVIPVLEDHAPIEGQFHYAYFRNIDSVETPGRVYITATSEDYVPRSSVGSPWWFAGKITPTGSLDFIEDQMIDAGIRPLFTEKIEIDGRSAVRAYTLHGFFDNYVSVVYLFPFISQASPYDTLMIMRTIESFGEEGQTLDDLIAEGKLIALSLKDGNASEQAMRRLEEFDTTVQNLHFIQ